jgi:hypothetical protein
MGSTRCSTRLRGVAIAECESHAATHSSVHRAPTIQSPGFPCAVGTHLRAAKDLTAVTLAAAVVALLLCNCPAHCNSMWLQAAHKVFNTHLWGLAPHRTDSISLPVRHSICASLRCIYFLSMRHEHLFSVKHVGATSAWSNG